MLCMQAVFTLNPYYSAASEDNKPVIFYLEHVKIDNVRIFQVTVLLNGYLGAVPEPFP